MGKAAVATKPPAAAAKTVSEPIAIPGDVDDPNVQRLRMDTDAYDYVKVEPKLDGVKGTHTRGPAHYRGLGFRTVPIQNRDDAEVHLLYPGRTIAGPNGTRVEIPPTDEYLHPQQILMARPKHIGDALRAAEDKKNNPDRPEAGDVRFGDMMNMDGVLAQERDKVDLRNLEDVLPSQATVAEEQRRRDAAGDSNPEFRDKLAQEAMTDDRIAS